MKKSKILVATLTAAAIAVGCGAFAGCKKDDNDGGTQTPPAHVHNWATTWTTTDDTNHWYACLNSGHTGDQKDVAPHEYDNAQDTTCNICGHVRTVSGGEEGPAATISINKDTLTLGIGNTEAELEATITNGAQGAEIVWSSDNESVVLVGESTGAVQALKPGSATITATIKDTQIKATCDVLVEDAYYIIGGADSQWNKCAAFGVENVIYFMPDTTEGIYKTKSFELKKGADFQVAPVGITADIPGDAAHSWWGHAYNANNIAQGDEVLSKKQGNDNIAVSEHAMYTITLDLTGDKAVISGEMNGDPIEDSAEIVYYLRGAMNGWAEITDPANVGDLAFTDEGDGTYTKSVDLTKGQEFKVAIVDNGWIDALGAGKVHGAKIAKAASNTSKKIPLAGTDNIVVGVSGTYNFTITADGVLDYTFTATAATEADAAEGPETLYYFIKGTASGGWDSPTALQETGAGSGIYTATLTLTAGEFMFISSTSSTGSGSEFNYFNTSNMTLDAEGGITTNGSNYVATAEEYVIKLNLATRTVEISYPEEA